MGIGVAAVGLSVGAQLRHILHPVLLGVLHLLQGQGGLPAEPTLPAPPSPLPPQEAGVMLSSTYL